MIHAFKNIILSRKSSIIFLFVLNISGFYAFAQSDIFRGNDKIEFKDKQGILSEKIFVHSDKSFYMAGELLWFKVYAVDDKYNRLMIPERFTYIEVLDKNNSSVLQAKISMKNGMGNGSFFLPISINTGNYTLRAYTNWMKNFDPSYYFEKTITIFNPLKRVPLKINGQTRKYAVGFFPEGGNLVNGLKSKMGVKVSDQYGKGIEFSGYIVNQDKDTVARFRNFRYGMCSFDFTPEKNTSYHAIVVLSDTTFQSSVPNIYPEGFVMHVADTTDNKVKIVVHGSNNSTLPIYLIAKTREIESYSVPGTLVGGEAVFLIDKTKLDDGFSTLTIFDNNTQPVCERLYFKKPKALKINFEPDSAVCGIRKKINVDFHARSEDGKSIAAGLSVAVYLVDDLQPVDEMNIVNYLTLSSDIRGVIESPGVYFQDSTEFTVEALENLILTQGWRKFYRQIHDKKEDLHYTFAPEFQGQMVRGRITDKTSGLGVSNISAYLSIPGKNFQFAHSRSNENGDLVFVIPSIDVEAEMIAQIADRSEADNRIEILNPFSKAFSISQPAPFIFSPRFQELYEIRSIASQVQNIYFGDSLQRVFTHLSKDSAAFYGRPDKSYYLDTYTRFNSMEEVFREYVQGVILRKSHEKFHFRVLNTARNIYFDDDPLILVDGVPVTNVDSLIAFDPLKFSKIDIVTAKYIMGADELEGILSLRTYSGNMAGFPLDPQSVVTDESFGSGQLRQFYSPLYNDQDIPNHLPDFRNLLYWSPDLQVGENGSGHFAFYSSDQKGRYAIVIQGISSNGEPGYGIRFIDVNDENRNPSVIH